MDRDLTQADIESLAGRPDAFGRVATGLLRAEPELRAADWTSERRWGLLCLAKPTRTLWWVWPWAPDCGHEPWSSLDGHALGRLRALLRREVDTTLRLVVPRLPADPHAWVERLRAWLGETTARANVSVRIEGPAELLRWSTLPGHERDDGPLRIRWTLAARPHDYSAGERELIAALDRGEAAREQWLVIADELQARGDPTGVSLALALASRPEQLSRSRELSRAYLDHESRRMAVAPRHLRMLAFIDPRGSSFAADEFSPTEPPRDPAGFAAQLWAERVGPFFVRLLVRTDDPEWRELGLPAAVFEAPELRYLSPARTWCIDGGSAELSGCNLFGFVLGKLMRSDARVVAYEANLRGTDLRGADLRGWSLDGADLRGAVADLDTNFGAAVLDDARVSPELQRLLASWNAGRHRPQRGPARGTASVNRLIVE